MKRLRLAILLTFALAGCDALSNPGQDATSQPGTDSSAGGVTTQGRELAAPQVSEAPDVSELSPHNSGQGSGLPPAPAAIPNSSGAGSSTAVAVNSADSPVRLTPEAADYILQWIGQQNSPEPIYFRVTLRFDFAKGYLFAAGLDKNFRPQADAAFASQGVDIVLDKMSLPLLKDTTVSLKQAGGGPPQFEFKNPHVK